MAFYPFIYCPVSLSKHPDVYIMVTDYPMCHSWQYRSAHPRGTKDKIPRGLQHTHPREVRVTLFPPQRGSQHSQAKLQHTEDHHQWKDSLNSGEEKLGWLTQLQPWWEVTVERKPSPPSEREERTPWRRERDPSKPRLRSRPEPFVPWGEVDESQTKPELFMPLLLACLGQAPWLPCSLSEGAEGSSESQDRVRGSCSWFS